jgi:AcrR family transcriptional regulator
VRADAQRSFDALLQAAKEVFVASGVDAPVRDIAAKAGVGVGTLYRHFPQRSDLIIAIFRHELDACALAADTFAAEHPPGEALAHWMQRYVDFVTAKHGLSAALHSGDPVYAPLRDYFDQRLKPALQMLLDRAEAAGSIRPGAEPGELLSAASGLCWGARDGEGWAQARRMVALLVDGLRYGAEPRP